MAAIKEIAKTEYALEVNDKSDNFVRQIDVFKTYDEAEEVMGKYTEPLKEGEYLNIIGIDYDENGDEVGFHTVC